MSDRIALANPVPRFRIVVFVAGVLRLEPVKAILDLEVGVYPLPEVNYWLVA
jgi:hypothetical protein